MVSLIFAYSAFPGAGHIGAAGALQIERAPCAADDLTTQNHCLAAGFNPAGINLAVFARFRNTRRHSPTPATGVKLF